MNKKTNVCKTAPNNNDKCDSRKKTGKIVISPIIIS